MKNRTFVTVFAAVLFIIGCLSASAQIPSGYYSSLKGKKGAELKNAVHEIIKNATVLGYGSGSGKTWEGFYSTDRTEDNRVIDRYSNEVWYFGKEGSVVSGMNIEHSFPKSWWGGATNQAYKDLYNLMPCEQTINTSKSNYPMGKVVNVKTDNGCTKVGTGSNGNSLWEPADKWKGDFARGYMYMATAYQNLTWDNDQAFKILQQGDYPTLQKWAYTLYIEWAKADKVDEIEVKRNDAVYQIQGNRNPFVDYPNLMEYIWGDSINYEFDPDKSLMSTNLGGGSGPSTIYSALFNSTSDGNFTSQAISGDVEVWTLDNKYGWTGTGYVNNSRHATEALLVSPQIDLADYSEATMVINHTVNYLSDPSSMLSVEVLCDGTYTVLDDVTWPAGTNWNFIDTEDISLSAFAGKKINIVFRYKSTTSQTPTWEIKKVTIKGTPATSGIDAVTDNAADFDTSRPYKAFSIDGRTVNPDTYRGIMIVKQGKTTFKIIK